MCVRDLGKPIPNLNQVVNGRLFVHYYKRLDTEVKE